MDRDHSPCCRKIRRRPYESGAGFQFNRKFHAIIPPVDPCENFTGIEKAKCYLNDGNLNVLVDVKSSKFNDIFEKVIKVVKVIKVKSTNN